MIMLSDEVSAELFARAEAANPTIACGLLFGHRQGHVTYVAPLDNVAEQPTSDWQLDSRQLARILSAMTGKHLHLQGIYYASSTDGVPSAAIVRRWRHNVPCLVVSKSGPAEPQVRAFSIDLVRRKAVELPLAIGKAEEPREPIDPPPAQNVNAGGATSPHTASARFRVDSRQGFPAADVTLGEDVETGETIQLSAQGRRLSTYVIGNIGTGKSTLLEQIAIQDMHNDDGLCFLDPHEDAAERILLHVPLHRQQDVIFWDPTDRDYPFGLNPFSCLHIEDVDSKASNFIAALESLAEFSEAFANAPRMKSILRHLALTFLLNQGSTLAETPQFLTSQSYRARFYEAIPPEYANVRDFWERFDRRPEREQRELSDSSLNKLERFQIDRTMRAIFGQRTNSIDFRAAMDGGKIIIVKLSSHRLGVDNAAFVGAFVVWEIFQAALSRADTPESDRKQFHLIADEFQTYMTTAFPQLIEQVRKFGVDVTVAHQRRDQLPPRSQNAPLVAGNKIVFGVTGQDASELAKEFKITIPDPVVTSQRSKYQVTPQPLQHLDSHGHEDPKIVDAYRRLRRTIDDLFEMIMRELHDQEYKRAVFDANNDLRHIPLSTIREFPPRQERFTQAINELLYRMMLASQEQLIKIAAQIHDTVSAADRRLYLDVCDYERVALVRTAMQTHTAQLMTFSEELRRIERDLNDAAGAQRYADTGGKRLEDVKPTPQLMAMQHPGSIEDWQTAFEVDLLETSLSVRINVLGFELQAKPCLIQTGQLEPILDSPRLYSDLAAEIANTLATLPRFTAHCKVIEDKQAQEYTIRTFDRPQVASQPLASPETSKLTSRRLYGRERTGVEAELAKRLRPSFQTDKTGVKQANLEAADTALSEPKLLPDDADFWVEDK